MIRRILAPFVLWLYRHLFIFEQDTLGTAEWRARQQILRFEMWAERTYPEEVQPWERVK